MNDLKRLQKMLKRMRILLVIAEIICAVLALLTAAAAVVWLAKGETYISESGGFLAHIAEALDFGDFNATFGTFCADAVVLVTLTALFAFTVGCINRELAEGTPFTCEGAKRVRTLGLIWFFLSLGAEMAIVIIREVCAVSNYEEIGVFGGMAAGIVFIIMSAIIKYGAALEKVRREELGERS